MELKFCAVGRGRLLSTCVEKEKDKKEPNGDENEISVREGGQQALRPAAAQFTATALGLLSRKNKKEFASLARCWV